MGCGSFYCLGGFFYSLVIRKKYLDLFSVIFGLLVVVSSGVFSFYIYTNTGEDVSSILWGIYAFGAFLIPGLITAFPGHKKKIDRSGLEISVPRGKDLSKNQALLVFGWIVGVGLLLVYVTQF